MIRFTNTVPSTNQNAAPANTSRKPRWLPMALNVLRMGAKMAGASAVGSVRCV